MIKPRSHLRAAVVFLIKLLLGRRECGKRTLIFMTGGVSDFLGFGVLV